MWFTYHIWEQLSSTLKILTPKPAAYPCLSSCEIQIAYGLLERIRLTVSNYMKLGTLSRQDLKSVTFHPIATEGIITLHTGVGT